MSKIIQVTISKNRKFSLPRYENVDFGVSLTIELGETDTINLATILPEYWDMIGKEIERQAREYPNAQGPDLDPDWLKDGKKTKRAKKGNLSTKTKR